MTMLKKSENRIAFAKVGIYGEAGSGKTLTAAKIAIGLYKASGNQKPVAMFDTEPAASYIRPLFEKEGIEFLVYDESRALKDLMAFVDEAEKECSVVIADSITHVWRDACDSYLKVVNENAQRRMGSKYRPIYKLEFHHWAPIKAEWHKFTDRYLASKVHFIVCGRAGNIYEYQKNEETGKMELITVGSKMATEKELGYEPSLLIEMVKVREEGRIINRALVEKDRTDTLNGNEIDYPTFDSFKPHFDFINIGGEHFGAMNTKDSTTLFTIGAEDDGFGNEKKKREILCEEIKSLFIKHSLDGTGKEEKLKRNEILLAVFGTGSWTAVEDMNSDKLRGCYQVLKARLEPEPEPWADEIP